MVAGVLEFGLTFWRQHVIMWPASALLTGNGVAFVLRVPGTEHGDWWSMKGWWIFAGTSAVALLSKYVIRVRGNHVFNPSNFGLVLCFLLLGAERADPLALWWGPLSPALVVALVLIVVGGFLILRRLHLLQIAVGFWLAFAAGIGVLAASGHTMTAAWHVGPIEGAQFWWLLVSSPEILVFLFFMITDPKTTPSSNAGRRAYAIGVGLLATLLIAPQTTEFATKVAILASLAIVCAARGLVELVGAARLARLVRRPFSALPRTRCRRRGARRRARVRRARLRRRDPGTTGRPGGRARPPTEARSPRSSSPTGRVWPRSQTSAARTIARNVLVDLRIESEALRRRDLDRAAAAAGGAWLASLWAQIRTPGAEATVARYDVDRDGADAAPRRVPGAAERRRESPGHVCRLDVRPDRGGTRVPRPGQIPEDSGARCSTAGPTGSCARREVSHSGRRRASRRAERSAERRSSTSRNRWGSTSGRGHSASASRTTRRR